MRVFKRKTKKVDGVEFLDEQLKIVKDTCNKLSKLLMDENVNMVNGYLALMTLAKATGALIDEKTGKGTIATLHEYFPSMLDWKVEDKKKVEYIR